MTINRAQQGTVLCTVSSDRSMDPLNDRLLDPPHQPLEGLVRWVCDEPASLTPESVLTGTKERREKLLSSFRANGFHGVVKLPLGFKNH